MQPIERVRRNPRRNGEHSPQIPARERRAAIREARQRRQELLAVTATCADLRQFGAFRP